MKKTIGALALLALTTQTALAGAGDVPPDLKEKIIRAVSSSGVQAFRHQECGLTDENREVMADNKVNGDTVFVNQSKGAGLLASGAGIGALGAWFLAGAYSNGEISTREGKLSVYNEGIGSGAALTLGAVTSSFFGLREIVNAKDNDTSPLGREFLMNDGKIDNYAKFAAAEISGMLNFNAEQEAALRSAIRKDALHRIRTKNDELPDLYAVLKSTPYKGGKLLGADDEKALDDMRTAYDQQVLKLRQQGLGATTSPDAFSEDKGIAYLRNVNAGLEKCAAAKDDENVRAVVGKNKDVIRLWNQYNSYEKTGRAGDGDEGPRSQEREVSPVD